LQAKTQSNFLNDLLSFFLAFWLRSSRVPGIVQWHVYLWCSWVMGLWVPALEGLLDTFHVCADTMALTWGATSLALSRNCPTNSSPNSGITAAHLTCTQQQQTPVPQRARPLVQFSEYLTTPRSSVISQDCATPGMNQHSIHQNSWVSYFTNIFPSYGSVASLKIPLHIRTWFKLHDNSGTWCWSGGIIFGQILMASVSRPACGRPLEHFQLLREDTQSNQSSLLPSITSIMVKCVTEEGRPGPLL
jgi:hypothetical protein